MLEMPKEYENVKYFGLGPDVNLPDYKEHTFNGILKQPLIILKKIILSRRKVQQDVILDLQKLPIRTALV